MAKTWAISGIDLHVEVTGPRVRAGLESALREAVRNGRLAEGTRLPSSRVLAGDLGIARNTVADAYGQLVAEGWLTARAGAGTKVAARSGEGLASGGTAARPAAGERPRHPGARPQPRVPDSEAHGPAGRLWSSPARLEAEQPRYDLRAGSPALSMFPRPGWLAAARRALTTAPAAALGYGDPRGLPHLRTALAGYLARARGVHADPERIVVCSGVTQGLALLARVLRDRGGAAAGVEAYGHRLHREILAAAGLRVRPLPVDALGADVGAAGDAAAVVLTPAHQFPLGMPMAPQRRTDAVRWARDTGGLVVEDDYDGEFRYDRQPVGALQALDPGHVVYAGTASKTLAPGLRLAWLAVPERLVPEVTEAKRLAEGQNGVFEQLTFADFLAGGGYDRHVRRSRLAYRRRRDRLVAALHRQAPLVRVTGIAAGLHAVLQIPAGLDEDQVVGHGHRHGLALEGLRDYLMAIDGRHATGNREPALVVGYATPPDHAFSTALARLCAVLSPTGSSARRSG